MSRRAIVAPVNVNQQSRAANKILTLSGFGQHSAQFAWLESAL